MTAMTQQQKQHRSWKERASTELHDLADSTGKIVILDFILGMTLGIYSVSFGGLRLSVLGGFLLVLVGFSRKPKYQVPKAGVVGAILIVALAWATLVSFYVGISEPNDIIKRLMRITSFALLVLFIADGRVNLRSIVFGLSFISLINIPAFYLGFSPNAYGGTLTGWFYDKNVSGLYYATVAILMVALLEKKSHKIFVFTIYSGALWQTGSRTSIAALGFAVLWALFARNLNLFFKGVLAVLLVRVVNYLEENYSQVGEFSNRVGSDLLRQRIDAASQAKIDIAPWYGQGLGQAFVDLGEGGKFFFHNSYWTLLIEAGWPYLFLILGATVYIAFIIKQNNSSKRILFAEGATVLLLICSWRLGEVFLTMSWVLIVGYGLLLTAKPIEKRKFPGDIGEYLK